MPDTKNYHHGDLRAALIAETLLMIKQDEAHLIGFRELARRLDVSRTAPYRHFKSVEDLLATVTEEGYLKFVSVLEQVTAKKNLENGERFVELGIAYVNFAIDNPAHYRLLFDQRFFLSNAYKTIQQLASRAYLLLKETSSRCLEGDATAAEKFLLADLAWACVHGLSSLLMNGQLRHVKNKRKFIRASCERLLAIAADPER